MKPPGNVLRNACGYVAQMPARPLCAGHLANAAVERGKRFVIRDDRRSPTRRTHRQAAPATTGPTLFQWKSPVHRERKRHRGIEVSASHSRRHITPHRHGQAPGDVDRKRSNPHDRLLSTVCATTPTPKTIRTNVPRNSASTSRTIRVPYGLREGVHCRRRVATGAGSS